MRSQTLICCSGLSNIIYIQSHDNFFIHAEFAPQLSLIKKEKHWSREGSPCCRHESFVTDGQKCGSERRSIQLTTVRSLSSIRGRAIKVYNIFAGGKSMVLIAVLLGQSRYLCTCGIKMSIIQVGLFFI